MKIFLAVLGFIVGNLLGVILLAGITTASDTAMGNPFILATIVGVIFAIIGYNLPKNKQEKE